MSVKFAILALLAEEPMYGHQLKQRFEARTGSTWELNIGQVYTTLTRLQRDGFVREGEVQADHSIVYSLTDAGLQALEQWWQEPVDPAVPDRDELAIKLALALPNPTLDVRAMVAAQRIRAQRTLHRHQWLRASLPSDPQGEDLAWLLVLDRLIFDTEAEARWLDQVDRRLAASQTTPALSVS